MEVLDAARMRQADDETIRRMKVPALLLMEEAGRLAAEEILDALEGQGARRALVFCGRGSNGGDGFVAARRMRQAGLPVAAFLVGTKRRDLDGDARAMADAFVGLGGEIVEIADEAAWAKRAPRFADDDIVVDALFGTGLSRPLAGLPARIVADINSAPSFVAALDVPSGLFASEARVPGPAVRADLTITFARPKPAHLLPPAEDYCGDVIVVDIGIPRAAVAATAPDLHWVTRGDAAALAPERDEEDNKGRFGHVLAVAGSVGKSGAAALVGWGALRAGAGLATVAAPAPARAEVAAFAAELMTEPLPATRAGKLARGAAEAALRLAKGRTVLALGPGLGTEGPTPAEVRRIVAASPIPVVLDADGINAFAGRNARAIAKHRAPLIVTPHPGEAARLVDESTLEIQADRVGWARRIAALASGVCVLKGYRTVVASADGQAFINSTGNPGMATGGMGDALTGMIAGLLAQGLEPLEASILAVYLHGLAADLAVAADESEPSLTAGALLERLPEAFRALDESEEEE